MKSMCVSSPMGLPQGFPPAIARCSVYQFRHLTMLFYNTLQYHKLNNVRIDFLTELHIVLQL